MTPRALDLLLLVLHGYFVSKLLDSANLILRPGSWDGLVLATSFVSTLALGRLVLALAGESRRGYAALAGLYLLMESGFFVLHIRLHAPLDFDFLADNRTNLGFAENWQMVRDDPLGLPVLAAVAVGLTLAACAALWILGLLLRGARRALGRSPPGPPGWKAPLVVYLATLVTPWYSFHDATYFLQTALAYLAPEPGAIPAKPYPYVRPAPEPAPEGTPRVAPGEKPHVFLVLIESFCGHFVEDRTPEGQEFTPVFNQLIDQGVYVERYYSNGNLTPRGQWSSLCGVPPSYRRAVFQQYPGVATRCLQEVLQDHGYRTRWIQAYKDLRFDSTLDFVTRHGFDEWNTAAEENLPEELRQHVWGWGLQDDHFYRWALDQVEAGGVEAPTFTVLPTIMNHHPFQVEPAGERRLYPEPETYPQHFANSIHLVDRALGALMQELRSRPAFADSLVVISGDHGFPRGEHSMVWATEYYEEAYRTPLLMLRPGHLPPRRVSGRAFSQLDLAPTLLGYLGIREPNHYVGEDILVADLDEQPPVLLSNPLFGRQLLATRYPWKYARTLRSGKEYLFHLGEDPLERNNLVGAPPDAAILEQLREDVKAHHRNQWLLANDQLWPRGPDGEPMDAAEATQWLKTRPE